MKWLELERLPEKRKEIHCVVKWQHRWFGVKVGEKIGVTIKGAQTGLEAVETLLHDAITVGTINNRMLKWLVVNEQIKEHSLETARAFSDPEEGLKWWTKNRSRLEKILPDISDILEEK